MLLLIGALILTLIIVAVFWLGTAVTNDETKKLSPNSQLSTIVNRASAETQFANTAFDIYDKSTEDYCNRLIVVRPFDWFIWAIGGQVWLLNDTNLDAPIGKTSATKIPNVVDPNDDNLVFETRNLNIQFSDIFESYQQISEDDIQQGKLKPVRIKFKIEDLQSQPNRFTVLDALNYLFKHFLTQDSPEEAATRRDRMKNKLGHIDILRQYDLENFKSAQEIKKIIEEKYTKNYLTRSQELQMAQLLQNKN